MDHSTDGNGQAAPAAKNGSTKPRATASSMAAKQKEISVSEFFAKNRHLLGFDNPRKALLTTVKEAVDNSLDACEEAGIVPEIWVAIEPTGPNRYRVSVQDNGPGIVKQQIPLIFGKLLYGSKFHRLRMSRGQQGIGISAAGMYGMLSTGKPVKILSKTSPRKPIHYYEIQIDTKKNKPDILNGKGQGEDITAPEELTTRQLAWEATLSPDAPDSPGQPLPSGTRVTIELEAKHQRGRGSVDEYLEQTAIANPHVTVHYRDPDGTETDYVRATRNLPPEPQEIKPHPYGVELGRLMVMLKETKQSSLAGFLTHEFSRVSSSVAKSICDTAKLRTRASTTRIGRNEVDALYQAIQETKISNPTTDCITPIGEELLLKGLRQVLPGEFYTAATRPPAVYRGNPFQVEVALAYGGAPTMKKVGPDLLDDLLNESDARTVRQFLVNTFDGVGPDGADKLIEAARIRSRQSPGKLKPKDRERLLEALQQVNLSEGQTMRVLRYANRVPLQFQEGACAITQAVKGTNWKAYGLAQTRGGLPSGPVSVMIHLASVWVPFTSESKEAIANYPDIQKEIRLALQAVGRKLGVFLRRRQKVRQQGERRTVFLRYLKEVADAVSQINGCDSGGLYDSLLAVANAKTADADMQLDERGQVVDEELADELGENVVLVDAEDAPPVASNGSGQGKLFD